MEQADVQQSNCVSHSSLLWIAFPVLKFINGCLQSSRTILFGYDLASLDDMHIFGEITNPFLMT